MTQTGSGPEYELEDLDALFADDSAEYVPLPNGPQFEDLNDFLRMAESKKPLPWSTLYLAVKEHLNGRGHMPPKERTYACEKFGWKLRAGPKGFFVDEKGNGFVTVLPERGAEGGEPM